MRQFTMPKFAYLMFLPVCSFAAATYTVSGVFDSGVPVSPWSSPNTAFSLSFTLEEPVVPTVFDAQQWDVQQPITYYLGGSLVPTFVVSEAFWDTPAGGLTVVLYGTTNALRLDFSGPQLSMGPTSAPILVLPQSFAPPATDWLWATLPTGTVISGGIINDAFVTTTPEPGSLLLGLMAIAGAGLIRRLRMTSRS